MRRIGEMSAWLVMLLCCLALPVFAGSCPRTQKHTEEPRENFPYTVQVIVDLNDFSTTVEITHKMGTNFAGTAKVNGTSSLVSSESGGASVFGTLQQGDNTLIMDLTEAGLGGERCEKTLEQTL